LPADPDFIAPLLGALRDLLAWFHEAKVRGVIVGGVAASLQGEPRVTRDVDAVVLLDYEQLKTFLVIGTRYGFAARLSDPLKFARKSRMVLLTHQPSAVTIDLSLGAMPFEEEMVSRAKIVEVSGVRIPVASPEDLIIMKALPMRDVDVRDIVSLLEVFPKLDRERVRHWVRQFAEVMEMPEISERLETYLDSKPRRKKK
jgi:hypothetical protein